MRSRRRIPVLTYHSHRILGDTYPENDHLALHDDLRRLHQRGFRVVPLAWVVEWLIGARSESSVEKAIAIAFDDGADFDFIDLDHPVWGRQRSFLNLLRDFRAEENAQGTLHATTFVIASPVVRRELDASCLIGRGWMSDEWWFAAARSGLMDVQNHSWDHNHEKASRVCQREQRKGSFAWIETDAECRAEIEQAGRYIGDKVRLAWPNLFAYPGGASSAYVREVYFPWSMERHRTLAAFAADGGYVERRSPRWNVPRFVFGAHWRDPAELERILDGAA